MSVTDVDEMLRQFDTQGQRLTAWDANKVVEDAKQLSEAEKSIPIDLERIANFNSFQQRL